MNSKSNRLYTDKQIAKLSISQLLIVVLFAIQAICSASGTADTAWMGSGGAVLLQQRNGSASTLALQAFTENAAGAHWTTVPENADEWIAVAMDRSRVLLFYAPEAALALCTLDETGTPAQWLPLKEAIPGFVPVALEGNTILMQNDPEGIIKTLRIDDEGHITSEKLITGNARGWMACGMHANRIVLEHAHTGHVVIWATNPTAPLFRSYKSFMIPDGWSVRDLAGNFILIQQGETGPVRPVELGDGYQLQKDTELVSAEGWCAVALAK